MTATEMSTSPSKAAATALGLINQHQEGTPTMSDTTTTTEGLIFEEPPPAKGGRGNRLHEYAALIAPLRDRPGQWARLPGDHNPATATHIKRGKYAGLEPGEFEAVSRNFGEKNRVHIYVRFVGQDATAAA